MRPGDVVSHQEMCVARRAQPPKRDELPFTRPAKHHPDEHAKRGTLSRPVRRRGPCPHLRRARRHGTEPHESQSQVDRPAGPHSDWESDQNGMFFEAARRAVSGETPELVRVTKRSRRYRTFNGIFALTDAWKESDGHRMVFKFRLEIRDLDAGTQDDRSLNELEHTRLIPSAVKVEVWKRDKGKCCLCGSSNNLHFDHDLPFSKGGTSLSSENIRLLCRRHNLQKRDRIE